MSPLRTLALLALTPWLAADPEGASPPRTGESARLAYEEDEGSGRTIADIRATLEPVEGGFRLILTASAEGADVLPVPGFEGVRGSNRITAREIDRLLAEKRVEIFVRRGNRHGRRLGDVRENRRGHVAERHVRDDGSIDYDGTSRQEYALELFADSGLLEGDGFHVVELSADGRVRLRADVQIRGSRARIAFLKAVSDHESK